MRFLSLYYQSLESDRFHHFQKSIETILAGEIHTSLSSINRLEPLKAPYHLTITTDVKKQKIDIIPDIADFQLLTHGQDLLERIARAVAYYIVKYCESDLISKQLKQRCYKTNIESTKVERYCYYLLNSDPWEPLGKKFSDEDRLRREQKLVDELIPIFEENTEFHIDGYIRFRMLSYKREIKEVIEYAIDEYILDQQYEEFMTLLKYFVGLQETKIDIVHLLQQNGSSFILLDNEMKPLELKHENDRIVAEMLETEMNIEDIVISSLIAASPEEIVVHARQPEFQVVRTVKAIFGDRATVCENCQLCRHNQEESIFSP